MSYQALYRVWRPQRFDEISGQTMVKQTLKNAISQGNTSHAYLFSGPRGTGKTSAAKIFAKAINCPNSIEGEPCNQCNICRQITEGSLGDVIEIDAASNNGVEEIRDIREKANYAPTQAAYKIYIIDEVHMLSMGAFNALLKTLEEPPENVIFILATTEPHKLPLTIISRTQRFDFKRISSADIIEQMQQILVEKEIGFDPDALQIIANAAEGGMRDALSLLDQSISFMDESLTVEDALQITGSITQGLLIQYIESIKSQNTELGLSILNDILAEGKDASRFIEDAILLSRDLLLYKSESSDDAYLKLAKIDDQFKNLAQEINELELFNIIQVFNETQQELRLSNHAEVYLEVATVKLCQSQRAQQVSTGEQAPAPSSEDVEVVQLKNQIQSLEHTVEQLSSQMKQGGPSSQPAPKKPKSRSSNKEFKVNIKAVHSVLKEATKQNLIELQELWPDLINVLDDSQRGIMRNSKPVAASPSGLVVTFKYDILCETAENDEALQEALANYLEKVIGHRPRLTCVTEDKWPEIRQSFINQMKKNKEANSSNETEQEEEAEERSEESNEVVDKAIELFGKDRVNIKE